MKKPIFKFKNDICGIKNKKFALIFTSLGGISAGFVNGVLGAGGGIIALFALQRLTSQSDAGKHDAFANALIIMPILSAISLLTYVKGGILNNTSTLTISLIIPALIGGAVGAFLQNRFDIRILKLIFSIVIVYSGIRMIIA